MFLMWILTVDVRKGNEPLGVVIKGRSESGFEICYDRWHRRY